ncbi:hypothetical protein RXV94_07230 [Yeosuana sp. MJ-SS3]|uniref:Uncharacterized protein n=1 Tax=Gilvirhabdus luticola TaxID=3079858 RepID=A0ABU3U6C0_9FLAO|nr:hypothetical protein [Yeosuana sp. MJ-SS3]MDU8885948.1 hypothetical protein [Yeosuana sp. MJ-SS3]
MQKDYLCNMQFFKTLHKWILTFLLFVTISGFSEVSTYEANFNNPQTELVVFNSFDEDTTAKYSGVNLFKSQQVTVNHYTVFSFESLLNMCHLSFRLALKTQKQKTFQFLDTNSILKQNLIAYKNTIPTHTSFVK